MAMLSQYPHDILLVEDNPRDLDLALRALKRRNIANQVQVVRDGQEALDYLLGEGPYAGETKPPRPKVVLLDLKLPKVSGLEVLRRVKGNPATQTIPIVVLTSSREDRDIVESYRLGVNSYIQKPVDFEQLLACVQELGLYWLITNLVSP